MARHEQGKYVCVQNMSSNFCLAFHEDDIVEASQTAISSCRCHHPAGACCVVERHSNTSITNQAEMNTPGEWVSCE